jgi:hypothetical protein
MISSLLSNISGVDIISKNLLVRVFKPDFLQEDYLWTLLFDQGLKVKSFPFEALYVEQEHVI